MMTKQSNSDLFNPQIEEALVKIAAVFPGTTVILPKDKAEKYAVEILMALANLIKINKGKRVDRGKLWNEMVSVVREGLMAADRLCDVDRRR